MNKIPNEDIFWVVGIVDSHCAVRSIVLAEDDPRVSDTHGYLFPNHLGMKWRTDRNGMFEMTDCRNFTQDELFAIQGHLIDVLGAEYCWFATEFTGW